MTGSVAIPFAGYAGWMFLKRTAAQQALTFQSMPQEKRDEAYFREKIGQITTAEQLVSDPRLLRTALTAFGLEQDMPNKYFIRRVLEDGTLKVDSLANKLSDRRYKEFSNAFGFGNFTTPRTALSDFADTLLTRYRRAHFEQKVGEQNGDFRLALNAEVELADLSKSQSSEVSKWYAVLGSPPLRQVFQKALNFPSSFANIDIDKQVEALQEKAARIYGDASVSQFAAPEKLEKLIRNFIVQSELDTVNLSAVRGETALSLLKASSFRYAP